MNGGSCHGCGQARAKTKTFCEDCYQHIENKIQRLEKENQGLRATVNQLQEEQAKRRQVEHRHDLGLTVKSHIILEKKKGGKNRGQ